MNRDELEHVIRAAADVAEDDEIIVVGSQAILGQFPDAPESLLYSQEADIYPRHDPLNAEAVDGAIGDGSMFHETYGYYAHGVGPETAKAPAGWQGRLVPIRVPRRPGGRDRDRVTGWCLEAHDLVLSKIVAGRDRDLEFAKAAIRHRLVDPETLSDRIPDLPVKAPQRMLVEQRIRGIVTHLQKRRPGA